LVLLKKDKGGTKMKNHQRETLSVLIFIAANISYKKVLVTVKKKVVKVFAAFDAINIVFVFSDILFEVTMKNGKLLFIHRLD
jgi:hypothetical protein